MGRRDTKDWKGKMIPRSIWQIFHWHQCRFCQEHRSLLEISQVAKAVGRWIREKLFIVQGNSGLWIWSWKISCLPGHCNNTHKLVTELFWKWHADSLTQQTALHFLLCFFFNRITYLFCIGLPTTHTGLTRTRGGLQGCIQVTKGGRTQNQK